MLIAENDSITPPPSANTFPLPLLEEKWLPDGILREPEQREERSEVREPAARLPARPSSAGVLASPSTQHLSLAPCLLPLPRGIAGGVVAPNEPRRATPRPPRPLALQRVFFSSMVCLKEDKKMIVVCRGFVDSLAGSRAAKQSK